MEIAGNSWSASVPGTVKDSHTIMGPVINESEERGF